MRSIRSYIGLLVCLTVLGACAPTQTTVSTKQKASEFTLGPWQDCLQKLSRKDGKELKVAVELTLGINGKSIFQCWEQQIMFASHPRYPATRTIVYAESTGNEKPLTAKRAKRYAEKSYGFFAAQAASINEIGSSAFDMDETFQISALQAYLPKGVNILVAMAPVQIDEKTQWAVIGVYGRYLSNHVAQLWMKETIKRMFDQESTE